MFQVKVRKDLQSMLRAGGSSDGGQALHHERHLLPQTLHLTHHRLEELRLKLEIRKMEIEAEERRELKRLAAEERAREAEERRDIQRLAAEKELLPEFDEAKVAEWFVRFERKAKEFAWSRETWVGLVVNKLKEKALEVYDKMSADDLDDYEKFKAHMSCDQKPIACNLEERESELVTPTSSVLVHWSKCLRDGLEARVLTLSRP
ncbi:hypothetical protein E2C01_086365 [Portunus trituberculatus]|uniref:Uncharacterized protein n=1 Tax=Portunus trituberculatus TaxID=210409 RepID=A0A5B7JD92_PORTR|nr:hypothetical protein [Portunus trituberculatus]